MLTSSSLTLNAWQKGIFTIIKVGNAFKSFFCLLTSFYRQQFYSSCFLACQTLGSCSCLTTCCHWGQHLIEWLGHWNLWMTRMCKSPRLCLLNPFLHLHLFLPLASPNPLLGHCWLVERPWPIQQTCMMVSEWPIFISLLTDNYTKLSMVVQELGEHWVGHRSTPSLGASNMGLCNF